MNARRLGCEASVLAAVHGAVRLGMDQELCCLLRRAGLGEDAVTAIRLRGSGREYGVILPTDRTWSQPRLRGYAFSAGFRALAGGHQVLIVPPADVRLQPRLANAHWIFQAKEVPACGDVDALTRCIEARGGKASLAACEAALASPLARERIFGLVFGGHLEMDLMTELTGESVVRRRPPCWTFGWGALGWQLLQIDQADSSAPPEATALAPLPH